ncbi:hypothetical protein D3C76_1330500 [compost metagenome]
MNRTAVASGIYIRAASLHIVIDYNGTIRQHIDLTFYEFSIRTETNAENDQICLMLTFACNNLCYLTVFACKRANLLIQCQFNPMILKRLFDRCSKFLIQIFTQNAIFTIN